MDRRPSVDIVAVAIVSATMLVAACGTGVSPASPAPPAATAAPASPAASASSPSPAALRPSPSPTGSLADRYREQAGTPDIRWVADLDGWFITSADATTKRTHLYPVSGVLDVSGEGHHLVVAMPEPNGIHLFEQSGGASSLIDAIRSTNVEVAGQETVDGRELTVLRIADPVEMSAFGTVDLPAGPETADLEVLVDSSGVPVVLRLSSTGSNGEPSAEVLDLAVRSVPDSAVIPQAVAWHPFESSRFDYVADVPDFLEAETADDFDTFAMQGYGGFDIRAYELDGQAPGDFVEGYIDFFANGESQWGMPTSDERYLTVGADGEGSGTLLTFHYERDGLRRTAMVALIVFGDRIWDVTWRGYDEHEIADRTVLLQLLSTWRFATD